MICTLLSALLFGFAPVLASISYEFGGNAQTVTFYRNLFAALILAAGMLIKKISFCIPFKKLLHLIWIGSIGSAFTTLTLYLAYNYIGIGAATTLHFLYPVFVALLGRLLFKEKIGRQRGIALLLASLGVAFFFGKGTEGSAAGIGLAVLSGLLYAVYMVGLERTGLAKMNALAVSFYLAVVVAATMLVYNVFHPDIVFALPVKALGLIAGIAVCTSALAVVLLQMGITRLGATSAAIFCLLEPISGVLFGIILLKEPVIISQIVGSGIVLSGIAWMILAGRPKKRKEETRAFE